MRKYATVCSQVRHVNWKVITVSQLCSQLLCCWRFGPESFIRFRKIRINLAATGKIFSVSLSEKSFLHVYRLTKASSSIFPKGKTCPLLVMNMTLGSWKVYCMCVFPQVPQYPGCWRPPPLLQACFPLVPNLPVGLYRLEIDHMRKARYLQWFFPSLVDDYWQVLGPCREGRTNAFLQMTVRQGKIEFSLPSICVCGEGNGWVS